MRATAEQRAALRATATEIVLQVKLAGHLVMPMEMGFAIARTAKGSIYDALS
jgi:hypothetical protein